MAYPFVGCHLGEAKASRPITKGSCGADVTQRLEELGRPWSCRAQQHGRHSAAAVLSQVLSEAPSMLSVDVASHTCTRWVLPAGQPC